MRDFRTNIRFRSLSEKNGEEDFLVKQTHSNFFLLYNMSSKKALIDSYLGGLAFLTILFLALINKKGKSSQNVPLIALLYFRTTLYSEVRFWDLVFLHGAGGLGNPCYGDHFIFAL